MKRNRLFAATLVVVMVCAAFAPAGAAAATTDTDDGALSVSVSQDDGVLVSVDANESLVNGSVENGTVTVAVDDNATYTGTGSYNISDDGTVELPTPDEQVDVTITATVGDTTAETSATLKPAKPDGLETLEVSIDDTLVTVTSNESAVANATVNVTPVDENATYDGAGEYQTDTNGTVVLPEPTETVDVTVAASYENVSGELLTAETETTLYSGLVVAVEQDDDDVTVTVTDNESAVANATVDVSTVDENVSYTDEGTYTTDENGTMSLSAPFENDSVEVVITATADSDSAETTVTLEPAEYDNFGALVSAFAEEQEDENTSNTTRGLRIANFVVEHNPGNAPDHAGPPSHAGPPGDDDDDDEDDDDDDERGPPEHAGPPTDDDLEDDDSEDLEKDDDDERGPPAHAGPPTDSDDEDDEDDSDDADDEDDSDDADDEDDSDDADDEDDSDDADDEDDSDDADDENDSDDADDEDSDDADDEDDSDDEDDRGNNGNGGGPPSHAGPN